MAVLASLRQCETKNDSERALQLVSWLMYILLGAGGSHNMPFSCLQKKLKKKLLDLALVSCVEFHILKRIDLYTCLFPNWSPVLHISYLKHSSSMDRCIPPWSLFGLRLFKAIRLPTVLETRFQ